MSVSKRLLWVDRACYPLENIARVHTFVVAPDRGAALMTFLKRLAPTLLVLAFVGAYEQENGEDLGVIRFLCLAFLVYSLVDLLIILFGAPHTVLAIETTGTAFALLTNRDPGVLTELVRRIARAIENPDTEFHVQVQKVTVNMKNYTGDTVNIFGGHGHKGILK
ncbi:DUF6232 family protein [Streptomyces sp. NPDC058659]|uniref:DUF6232 family protein n=1 Tax=unclassified Streptomyces TaxID=2593676 RepID=UPI00365AAD3F